MPADWNDPLRPENAVTLVTGGQVYQGWKGVRITRSMETLSNSFQLTLSDERDNLASPFPINEFDECEVWIGTERVIKGFIGDANPSFGAASRDLSVSGFDAVQDLVECSEFYGELAGLSLLELARKLAAPFGLEVSVSPGLSIGEKFPMIRVAPGETAWSVIEKYCKKRAVLAVSDGNGGVLLTRAGKDRATGKLAQEDMTAGGGKFSAKDRHSTYKILAQQAPTDDFGGALATQLNGSAKDAGVPRFRPLVISAGGSDPGSLAARAKWEASVRAGRSRSIEGVKVEGWRQPAAGSGVPPLWKPNLLVPIESPWLRVNGEMILSKVDFILDDQEGFISDLTFARKEAFELIPEPELGIDSAIEEEE
ncbi:MAG: phage baseplate assembly protein [Bdellovibrionota bacterium]